jgi:hypothetical protein
VVFDGVQHDFRSWSCAFNQPLCQPNRVLNVNVNVDQAVADQQRIFPSFGK